MIDSIKNKNLKNSIGNIYKEHLSKILNIVLKDIKKDIKNSIKQKGKLMEKLTSLLKCYEIIKEGHFKLRSGQHSDTYIQKDDILFHPIVKNEIIDKLDEITNTIINQSTYNGILWDNFVITGPATAGSMFAVSIANTLNLPFVYCEKENLEDKFKELFDRYKESVEDSYLLSMGEVTVLKEDLEMEIDELERNRKMIFRPNFSKFIEDKEVIIIEDIITTGGSVEKTINAVKKAKGKVIAVVCIWNRTGWKYPSIKVKSLITDTVISYKSDSCPLCFEGKPLDILK